MKRLSRLFAAIGIVAVAAAVIGLVVVVFMVRHGFSARDQPTRLEAVMARALRHWSIPTAAKRRENPLKRTPEMLMEARAHFADHCAQCHGNDGSGDTEIGRNLYPKPPDMRQRQTQDLSDGELFYIIENGVRLTGMPGWGGGGGHDQEASWSLVAFIRQLPSLTTEDLAAMQYLNPKSPEEWQEQQEEDSFLKGGAMPAPSSHHHGGH